MSFSFNPSEYVVRYCAKNNLPYLSKLSFSEKANKLTGLQLNHGFFFRNESISNVGYWKDFEFFYSTKQIHTEHVKEITSNEIQDELCWNFTKREDLFDAGNLDLKYQADAVFTIIPDIKIAVSSADCVPIIGFCSKTKYIFAIHCGWKGAVSNIFENLKIELLKKAEAVENKELDLHFLIGPSIFAEDYEFGARETEEIVSKNPNYQVFFIKKHDKVFFDVRSLVEFRLSQITTNTIDKIPINTYRSSEFSSFRRQTRTQNIDTSEKVKAKSFISFVEIKK
jgi:YfiH family protein